MVRYLIQASSNPHEKMCSPCKLSAWVTQIVERLGGRVDSLDYTIGEADLVLLLEMPEEATMVAFSELCSSAEKLKVVRVAPLIRPEQARVAMQKTAEASDELLATAFIEAPAAPAMSLPSANGGSAASAMPAPGALTLNDALAAGAPTPNGTLAAGPPAPNGTLAARVPTPNDTLAAGEPAPSETLAALQAFRARQTIGWRQAHSQPAGALTPSEVVAAALIPSEAVAAGAGAAHEMAEAGAALVETELAAAESLSPEVASSAGDSLYEDLAPPAPGPGSMPGAHSDMPPGSYELVAGRFTRFSELAGFSETVQALPGMKNVAIQQFQRGMVSMRIQYDDPMPLMTRLQELRQFKPVVRAIGPAQFEMVIFAESRGSTEPAPAADQYRAPDITDDLGSGPEPPAQPPESPVSDEQAVALPRGGGGLLHPALVSEAAHTAAPEPPAPRSRWRLGSAAALRSSLVTGS